MQMGRARAHTHTHTPQQQITLPCLPTLLEWHTLAGAHTHVFRLRGGY